MSADGGWYYLKNGETIGPMSRDELTRQVTQADGARTMVWGPGLPEWTEARHVGALGMGAAGGAAPPSPPIGGGASRVADEIDYELYGDDMQFVEVTLDPGEVVVAEAGGMMYMTQGIQMETTFGDPSKKSQGIFGKLMDAGKRMITGESLFLTTFGATGSQIG